MQAPLRTVVCEHKFEAELKKIEPSARRADELIEGAIWVLARNPKCGRNVPGTSVWCVFSRDVPKGRELGIFYTFNASHVILLSVVNYSLDAE
jgi:plasmid stabilization system protein ParE